MVNRGRTTIIPAGSEVRHNQQYRYDAANRLTEVQTPGGEAIASYQYDPLGRRIRKTEYRELNAGNWQTLATPRTTTEVPSVFRLPKGGIHATSFS